MRDCNGERLFPGDRVVLIGPNGARSVAVVKQQFKLVGSPAHKWAVRVKLGEMGYLPHQIVELNDGSLWPAKNSERIGTTFEPAEFSFKTLMSRIGV